LTCTRYWRRRRWRVIYCTSYINDIVKGCIGALDTAEKSTVNRGKKRGPVQMRVYNLGTRRRCRSKSWCPYWRIPPFSLLQHNQSNSITPKRWYYSRRRLSVSLEADGWDGRRVSFFFSFTFQQTKHQREKAEKANMWVRLASKANTLAN
jgi:hypothetical protein